MQTTKSPINNYINHIVFVVDRSGSMQGLADETVKVFDNQIAYLSKRSQELDQETRVSVYLFNNTTSCLVYDKDVMRLPSLKTHYRADGGTALIDATITSVDELLQTSQLHGDHAFLVYALTDGEENRSSKRAEDLAKKIAAVEAKDNWTVAVLVPNARGVSEAEKFGFPKHNIQIWSATSGGVEAAGKVMRAATDTFMTNRAKGIRSTRSLFKIDEAALTGRAISSKLEKLPSSKYVTLKVNNNLPIREFIEKNCGTYVKGSAFYQLTKTEEIQAYKQICARNKRNQEVYTGDNARSVLGLPNTSTRIAPSTSGNYDIFIQSTSVNRKLVQGTEVLVLK